MLVGDEARPAQAVNCAAAQRFGQGHVVGEAGGDEEVFDGEIAASGAAQSHNVPVVVNPDVGGADGGPDLSRVARLFRDHASAGGNPVGMAYAAGEGPASAEEVAAVYGHGPAEGREDPGGFGRIAVDEDFFDGVVGQESAHAPHAGRANHQAPAGRRLYLADGFQHVELGYEVGFCAAQHPGRLEAEQAGVVEGIDGCLGQGAGRLAFVCAGLQYVAHAFHRAHQEAALCFSIYRERLQATHPLSCLSNLNKVRGNGGTPSPQPSPRGREDGSDVARRPLWG